MANAQDDLWRDVSIVIKHVRFIAAFFIVALLVSAVTGLMTHSDHSARSSAEIERRRGNAASRPEEA